MDNCPTCNKIIFFIDAENDFDDLSSDIDSYSISRSRSIRGANRGRGMQIVRGRGRGRGYEIPRGGRGSRGGRGYNVGRREFSPRSRYEMPSYVMNRDEYENYYGNYRNDRNDRDIGDRRDIRVARDDRYI